MSYQAVYNASFGDLGVDVAKRWPEAPIIQAKGKKKDTLGIALSGGGYRSAIFCYGVLHELHDLGILPQADYLSVVSGGSWIGTAFAMAEKPEWFFRERVNAPNFVEEAFQSFLPNPARVLQEAALTRLSRNYASDIFGRLLAGTFLREHGDYSRFRPLSDATLIRENDRPFLIVNGTVNFRRPHSFDVTQECFEMTRLYCGSRSLGYTETAGLKATEYAIRIRDAVAISGAALAVHLPGLGSEVAGIGLSREVENYTAGQKKAPAGAPTADNLDVADGGFYNNLGIESLVNRGCGYIIAVDAEHDPEQFSGTGPRQHFHGLRTLLRRHHIPTPFRDSMIKTLDTKNVAVHDIKGATAKIPDVLYIKLKSSAKFDKANASMDYNQPGLLRNLFGRGAFAFDPQFSTAKLDYDFPEHRNLSELGRFFIREKKSLVTEFAARSK